MTASRKPEDTRTHARYFLRNAQIARVRFANNQSYAIRDISYSGFSIDAAIDRVSSDQVQMTIFDTSAEAFVTLAHTNGKFAGFAFQHRTVGPLIFLQPFVERLRLGSTLAPIADAALKEKYREGGWQIMRGDGPTDLKIKLSNNQLDTFVLTFSEGSIYAELRYANGKLTTAKQVDGQGVAARMAETSSPDRTLVRHGLYILAGLQDEQLRSVLKPCFALYK